MPAQYIDDLAKARKREQRDRVEQMMAADSAPPTSMSDALARRKSVIAEGLKIERELSKGNSDARRAWLINARNLEADRLRSLNTWIKQHRNAPDYAADPPYAEFSCLPWTGEPAPSPVVVGVDGRMNQLCACGRIVIASRGTVCWYFYCQDCGRDWQAPAAPLSNKKPRAPSNKCECSRVCRFCKKERR
jgi:hypothetical protein